MCVIVKNITGYEGLYLIDNLGNVVSCPRLQGSRFVNQYKIMGTKINRLGYKEVALSKDGKTKTYLLHRLIAIHFVPNPTNLPCVNHINGIKTDNSIENLEWCSRSYNTKHAYENNLGHFKEYANAGIAKMNHDSQYITVCLVSADGEQNMFNSTKEAAEYLGTNINEITRAIRKQQKVKGHKAFGLKRSDLR